MCGIFGYITIDNNEVSQKDGIKLLKKLTRYSERRGMESMGMAIKNHGHSTLDIYKQSIKASRLLKYKDFNKFLRNSLKSEGANDNMPSFSSTIGHTRIATNGKPGNHNNQPLHRNGVVCVQNGIVCNVEELWDKVPDVERLFEVDTELITVMYKKSLNEGKSIGTALTNLFKEIEGYTSMALMSNDSDQIVFATNCGSLYYFLGERGLIFASEDYTLHEMEKDVDIESFVGPYKKHRLEPSTYLILNEKTGELHLGQLGTEDTIASIQSTKSFEVKDHSKAESTTEMPPRDVERIKSKMQYNIESIKKLKRCTKCILPETHPFIDFDEKGVCNYCRNVPGLLTRPPLGIDVLKEKLAPYAKIKDRPNCIVLLSGGRDSCYGLHYIVKELGMRPIAYSYDWGMITDLGRRNQSRMCGKLGVEHLPLSADIKFKRDNVHKNVDAWLHKPHLGTVGLFMAGDKAFIHFAEVLSKQYGLPVIDSSSFYELTTFKYGFAGVEPFKGVGILSGKGKLKMLWFFLKQVITNPRYINSSVIDSLLAFRHYLFSKVLMFNLFIHKQWDEKEIEELLIKEYNWELAPDTSTSWRIGDGTVAMYNYIYETVAGFTENDCLRSNQIRMGQITREEGLERIYKENAPRYETLQWYCDIIDIDIERVIDTVNKMPKLYSTN